MKRALLALACFAAVTGVLADEPAKGKAKKQESQAGKAVDKTVHNLWISPSDRERRAKRKATKKNEPAK